MKTAVNLTREQSAETMKESVMEKGYGLKRNGFINELRECRWCQMLQFATRSLRVSIRA